MKWIIRQFGDDWLTRCPYCAYLQRWQTKPETWVCNRPDCHAIINESLYGKLSQLAARVCTTKDSHEPAK